MNTYLMIAFGSGLVILSYLFNQISKWSKIPSVIFLIGTGVALKFVFEYYHYTLPDLATSLKTIGVIGLMMIVLEGGLDLKLKREKIGMLFSALGSALFILFITNGLIAGLFYFFYDQDFFNAFYFAIPLSVVSSAIVIPSVYGLVDRKKEFMIIESTLSDIFGIMLFIFWMYEPHEGQTYAEAISWNIVISVGASLIVSYLLVWVFNMVKTEVKFFLFIAVLGMFFAIGEYFHYSSLLIVLFFGVILKNDHIFFRGPLKNLLGADGVKSIRKEMIMITNETSFLIRTFFFIMFGITMNLDGIFTVKSLAISAIVMLIIFATRALNLKFFIKSDSIFPEMLIAPRGLVTVLLFNQIVDKLNVKAFEESILGTVIIGTNLVMMYALIKSGKNESDLREEEYRLDETIAEESVDSESSINGEQNPSIEKE